tara:strand:+ start:10273 stop:10611 length:339 start_codon:yes stop_codon:yes gene_type:complete
MSWGAFLVSLLLGIIIPLASLILMETTPYSEKTKPYECGFNPIYQTGNPFSIRFFTVAILFLLFDLEVVILFPWVKTHLYASQVTSIVILIFFFALTLGLVYEWWKGILEWE